MDKKYTTNVTALNCMYTRYKRAYTTDFDETVFMTEWSLSLSDWLCKFITSHTQLRIWECLVLFSFFISSLFSLFLCFCTLNKYILRQQGVQGRGAYVTSSIQISFFHFLSLLSLSSPYRLERMTVCVLNLFNLATEMVSRWQSIINEKPSVNIPQRHCAQQQKTDETEKKIIKSTKSSLILNIFYCWAQADK